MANENIDRLLKALDSNPQTSGRGRVKEISGSTGYSEGMVSRILAGKVEPSEKFLMAVCNTYLISKEWIEEGKVPVFLFKSMEQPFISPEFTDEGIERIDREVFGLISPERREKERFIMGLVRRLPDPELKPVEDYLLDLVSKSK